MYGIMHSDIGRESDIEVVLEDDQSEFDEIFDSRPGIHGRRDSEGAEEEEYGDGLAGGDKQAEGEGEGEGEGDSSGLTGKSIAQADEEPGTPYLPRLKTSIIQMVLNINSELVSLCKEYQNNSLMDDPQLIMYQMRLQSNLAYLASVADHYMDPTRSALDLRPLPKPTLPSCQGSAIAAKLAHAREVYAAYASAWSEQQMELSRRAKTAMKESEKAQFDNYDKENLHECVESLLKNNRVVYEKSGDEPITPETFKPFPPFRLPEGTRLPPGLQKWSFKDNVAALEDSSN
ncbi:hypothetical protein GGI12_002778 [Dipsacomyces acuminosporus]|nr:hypothetical protein GGI12_002778 [Dipsacomyces acuminosporus]